MKVLKRIVVVGICLAMIAPLSTKVNGSAAETSEKKESSSEQQQTMSKKEAVPMVKSVKQITKNQIELTFDKEVDTTKATTPNNYWVQSVLDSKPEGVATLGKKDKLISSNALTSDLVIIAPVDDSNKVFLMTFKNDITPEKEYKLIVCYITTPGAGEYKGDNGSGIFKGK